MNKQKSIFVIVDKEGNFCTFGTKCAWTNIQAAKSAFTRNTKKLVQEWPKRYEVTRIDEQEDYFIEEIIY